MKPAFVFSLSIFLLICHNVLKAQDQGKGKVYIGPSSDAGTPPKPKRQYTFSLFKTQRVLPVYALVSRGNGLGTTQRDENITISCELSTQVSGFSGFEVQNVTLTISANETSVPLKLTQEGRAVDVTCYGETTQDGACAAGTAQFCPDTSQSNTVSIRIRPFGTVTVCDPVIIVYNEVGEKTFSVQLSETAEESPVLVTCNQTGNLIQILNSSRILVGQSRADVGYLLNLARDNESTVICTAESESGVQFNLTTSQGPSSLFKFKTDTVRFQPVYSQIYDTSFASLLTLSRPVGTGSVTITCQAKMVNSMVQAENEVANPNRTFTAATTVTIPTTAPITIPDPNVTGLTRTPVTTTRPTIPPDPNSEWMVVNSTMKISNGVSTRQKQYRVVIVQRRNSPVDVRTELVVTRCCAQSRVPSTLYSGQCAVAVAVANLAPFPCQDCDSNVSNSQERIIQNPGFVEVSPCSCDLSRRLCDINCCCDSDCSANEKLRFSGCVSGLRGGQSTPAQDYKCASTAFNLPDWHLMTCVYWESNAYLGLFYQNQVKLTTQEQINAAVSRNSKGKFSYSEAGKRYSISNTGYTYGSVVLTLRANVTSGILALSGKGLLGGLCNPLTPVQFLVERTSTCPVTLTADQCGRDTIFSASIYAVSSFVDNCPQSLKVIADRNGNFTPVDVRYHCATPDELSPYITNTTAPQPLGPTNISNFDGRLDGEDCLQAGANSICWTYNMGKEVSPTIPLPELCSWDKGYSMERASLSANTCQNTVLDVRYNFEWSGSVISKLTAYVVLGNVTIDSLVGQKFSVSWTQKSSNSSIDNYSNTDEAYQRSGAGGYEFGQPLQSGRMDYNNQSRPVDPKSVMQMSIWKPGVDNLCTNALRYPLTFGDDATSSCILRLNFDYLNNSCGELRSRVSNHLNVLMAANVIGQTGYNDPMNPEHWISVIRRNLSEPLPSSPTSSPIPDEEALDGLVYQIAGICLLPSAAELIILYAQTGARNSYPQLEVIGAYVNYTESNWTMNCAGANSERCRKNSLYVQNFFLTSSVSFVKVPATQPKPKIKFYTQFDVDTCQSDSCYRFFTDFSSDICYYDTCWQELAYPISNMNQGESRYYTLAVFLVLVLGVVGYVSVTKPGWS